LATGEGLGRYGTRSAYVVGNSDSRMISGQKARKKSIGPKKEVFGWVSTCILGNLEFAEIQHVVCFLDLLVKSHIELLRLSG